MVPAHLFRVLQAVFDRLRVLGGDEFFCFHDIDRVILRPADTDLALHIAVFITIGHRKIMLSVGRKPFDLPTDIFMADITAAARHFLICQRFRFCGELSGNIFCVIVKILFLY